MAAGASIRKRNVPEGQNENSPAFQRRERFLTSPSPEGTAESGSLVLLFQPSLRDSFGGCPCPGVETPGYCRDVPSGQKARKAAGTPEGFARAQNVFVFFHPPSSILFDCVSAPSRLCVNNS